MKPLQCKTWHHPTTSSNLCRTPHLNNKQNKKRNPIISSQEYHLTQPCPSEEKQTNNKNSAQISPYTNLTQTTGPTLGGQKPKGKKNSTFFQERIQLSLKPGKRRLQTQYLKKKKKRWRITAQMREHTRNTGVQNKSRGNRKIT